MLIRFGNPEFDKNKYWYYLIQSRQLSISINKVRWNKYEIWPSSIGKSGTVRRKTTTLFDVKLSWEEENVLDK